ncbi:DNA recombination protein RmuC [Fertoebacter nigrum]|uniref:DNA recombination protein RmuC homolog n=1 Tax=Fertoeibacter niger TaxID=2656921 RepID=A0A8X8KKH1_9RHOB|nr:DNA recombination protein RmuC [Fertoeibacter niger]
MIADLQERLRAFVAAHPALFDQPTLIVAGVALLVLILALVLRGRLADARAQRDAALALVATRDAALRDAAEQARMAEAQIARLADAEAARTEEISSLTHRLRAVELHGAAQATLAEQRQKSVAELTDERQRLGADLHAERGRVLDLARRVSTLTADLASERQRSAEKIELLQTIRKDMEDRFKLLADESMRQHGEELSKQNRERLEATLNPLKEHVGRFEVELRAVHEGAVKERQQLKTEIDQLTRRSEEVSREALALTRALKGDKQRQGAWGEMILATLLERSGLQQGVEYELQAQRMSDEGGRYRPDVVVRMPGDKRLVIDSKVSLVDYELAVNDDAEDLRLAARKRHVAAIKRHIMLLSDKAYQTMEDGSVDYVVMFIPIEGALSEALREADDLTTYAMERNVMIGTPTTLMMALRTVSHVWAIERRNRNAEEIARRAGLLYDKVAGFVDAMQAMGKNLGQAQKSYGDAMDRLTRGSGNVLGQVEKLKSLGAKASKSIATGFDGDEGDGGLPDLLPLTDTARGDGS